MKLLKVMSFVSTNRSLISEQGMQFIMKGQYKEELKQASPVKVKADADMVDDVLPGDLQDLSDAALFVGLEELLS